MAKPIKLTPVLQGNDAIRFLSTVRDNSTKTVSRAVLLAIRNGASRLQKLSKS